MRPAVSDCANSAMADSAATPSAGQNPRRSVRAEKRAQDAPASIIERFTRW